LDQILIFDYADSTFSNPLDSLRFRLPSNGLWLTWNLSGHRIIRVTIALFTAAESGLVSAIFFDAAP